jgi:hypothetical protein
MANEKRAVEEIEMEPAQDLDVENHDIPPRDIDYEDYDDNNDNGDGHVAVRLHQQIQGGPRRGRPRITWKTHVGLMLSLMAFLFYGINILFGAAYLNEECNAYYSITVGTIVFGVLGVVFMFFDIVETLRFYRLQKLNHSRKQGFPDPCMTLFIAQQITILIIDSIWINSSNIYGGCGLVVTIFPLMRVGVASFILLVICAFGAVERIMS